MTLRKRCRRKYTILVKDSVPSFPLLCVYKRGRWERGRKRERERGRERGQASEAERDGREE